MFGERIYLLRKNLSEWTETACDEECQICRDGTVEVVDAPEYHNTCSNMENKVRFVILPKLFDYSYRQCYNLTITIVKMMRKIEKRCLYAVL